MTAGARAMAVIGAVVLGRRRALSELTAFTASLTFGKSVRVSGECTWTCRVPVTGQDLTLTAWVCMGTHAGQPGA